MRNELGFHLRFDGEESNKYPNGYWYACTNDENWDADGDTPLNALANLVSVLHKALTNRDEEL
jgi:hypothetical protein